MSRIGRPKGSGVTPAIERFEAKVARTDDGCWQWMAATHPSGYGKFFVEKVEGRPVLAYAHRWSYEHHVGPIPDGLQLDHLCRNRGCVNPHHLEPVTCAENLARIPEELRRRPRGLATKCGQGHPFSGANLRVDKRGKQHCKACCAARARAYRRAAK